MLSRINAFTLDHTFKHTMTDLSINAAMMVKYVDKCKSQKTKDKLKVWLDRMKAEVSKESKRAA